MHACTTDNWRIKGRAPPGMGVYWCGIVFGIVMMSAMLEVIAAQRGNVNWDCLRMLESCELLRGIMGQKGIKGPPGLPGYHGPPGAPGDMGDPGDPGSSSRRSQPFNGRVIKGNKGDRGYPGLTGSKGYTGFPGRHGVIGVVGLPGKSGDPGLKGMKGGSGAPGQAGNSGIPTNNWKQCTFPLDLNKQTGIIHECTFQKKESETSVHVIYQGDTQIGLCGTCCKQWNFLFDNEACLSPGPIEATYSGLMLVNNDEPNTLPVFRHGSISGYCNNIPRGLVRVGLGLANCAKYPSDKIVISTDIKATGRFIIQEVASRPQS